MRQIGAITPHVIRVLRGRITGGAYSGKLPGERVLATEFKTNTRTVQHALMRLEDAGLVIRRSRSGTYVVPPEERATREALLHVRLLLSAPYVNATLCEDWSWLIAYGFKMAARERKIAVVTDYQNSVDQAVEEATAESAAPNCIGVCVLGLPVTTAQAVHLAAAPGTVVLADCPLEQPLVPTIRFDDLDGGRLAAKYLVELGHRRIAFAMPDFRGDTSGGERLRGTQDYLAGVGLKLARLEIYPLEEDHAALDRILSGPDRPTALIVNPMYAANYLFAAAVAKGVKMPRDLSLITFADPRTLPNRTLSIVAMDHEALGRTAFEALLDEKLRDEPRAILLPNRLMPRATTAPPG